MRERQTVEVGMTFRGWEVTAAEVRMFADYPGPIAGLRFVREGEVQFARLDMGKQMFIDEPPLKLDKRDIAGLTRRIMGQIADA